MTDVVFFLKAGVPKDLPAGVKGVVLEPPASCFCGGTDKYCSSAYSCLWQSLRDSSGRVIPNLRKKYNVDDKIAFAAFSAAHGFMNPLLNNDADRADTSAVFLFDAVFGGGKDGYVKAAKDAAAGKLLLVSVTSDKGTTDALNNGDYAWRKHVLEPAGLASISSTSASAPVPTPAGGVFRAGELWYYRFMHSELPHWEIGKILGPAIRAHLGSYLSGGSAGSKPFPWTWVLGGVAAAAWLFAWKRRKTPGS